MKLDVKRLSLLGMVCNETISLGLAKNN